MKTPGIHEELVNSAVSLLYRERAAVAFESRRLPCDKLFTNLGGSQWVADKRPERANTP